jgi:hypothetical protein
MHLDRPGVDTGAMAANMRSRPEASSSPTTRA